MMNPPILRLIGDADKCFTDLGIKDKNSEVKNSIDRLLKLVPDQINLAFEKHYPFTHGFIKEYAEVSEISLMLLHKKLLCFEFTETLNAFWKDRLQTSYECSIAKNKQELELVLRCSFSEFLYQQARLISYQIKGHQKVMTLSHQGFPLPGLISFNQAGIFVSMSPQTPSETRQFQARSQFDLVSEILFTCDNLTKAKKLLKKHSTLNNWNLQLFDQTTIPTKHAEQNIQYPSYEFKLLLDEKNLYLKTDDVQYKIENIWDKPVWQESTIKNKHKFPNLGQAFLALEENRLPHAFHQLQLAEINCHDEKLKPLLKFILINWQYLRTNETEMLGMLLQELEKLATSLDAKYEKDYLLLQSRFYKQLQLDDRELKKPIDPQTYHLVNKEASFTPTEFKIHKKLLHNYLRL